MSNQKNTGIYPIHGDPNVSLQEVIGPNVVTISLMVKDYKLFMDKLLSIKEGGQIRFNKSNPQSEIVVRIINTDTQIYGKKL